MSSFAQKTFVGDTGNPQLGCGVFAKERISAREVLDLVGEPSRLLLREAINGLPRRWRVLCYAYEFDDRYVVCPASFDDPYQSAVVNHSCDPNMASKDNWETVIALRDIEAGEEVTFDYCTFNDETDEFACACGAVNCRKVVTGKDWMLPELQERYRGYFQKNIQEKIDALHSGNPKF